MEGNAYFCSNLFCFFLFNQAIEERTPLLHGFHGFLQHRAFVPRVVGAGGEGGTDSAAAGATFLLRPACDVPAGVVEEERLRCLLPAVRDEPCFTAEEDIFLLFS